MTLFFYISPNSLFSGGIDLGATGVRLGQMAGWSQIADQGQAAFSEITFDDPTGALAVTGLRPFWVEETACTPSRLWTGYVTSRKYARDKDRSQIVGAARTTTVSFVDINAILDLRVIKNVDGKRPAETDLQRLAWLRSTYYLPVYDNGQVATTNGRPMSAADYRGGYAHDVLNDCAQESGRNYFIYWDPTAASGHELSIYYNALGSTVGFTSNLYLTNTNASINNSTVFGATGELNRDPQDVYSGVYMNYDGGHVYHSRPSTATTFIWREAVADAGKTKSRTVAGVRAERFLNNSDTEKDTIEARVQLPKDKVNLIDIGRGLRVHFDHLPGYTSGYTELQVAARQVNQSQENADYYQVDLHLAIPKVLGGASGPGSGAPFQPDCGTGIIVQSANGYDVLGVPYTVTMGGTPADGNILVAFASFGGDGTGGTMADVLTLGGTWTKGPTIEGYDAAQYGGPGGAVRMSAYYRTWTTGDPTSFLVTPGTAHSGVVIYEVGGVSAATISTGSVTGTMTAGNPYSVSATGTGFIIGGWAHQRTSYAPQDSYTTSVGTELWDYDESKGVVGGDAPWVYLGYNNGTNPAVTGTPAANPNLDRWARAAVWLFFDITDCATPLVGQAIPAETAGAANGTTSCYTTNYPYQPGSLVVTVNGITSIANETNPTTGAFCLPFTPPAGAVINWRYQAADDTATGANHPKASPTYTTVFPVSTHKGDLIVSDGSNWQVYSGGSNFQVFTRDPTQPLGVMWATPSNSGGAGSVGPQGIPGLQGLDGDDGEPGPPGPRGLTGVAGPAGIGPMGPPGMDGLDGEDAFVIPGARGVDGAAGAPGARGPAGGPLGLDGDDGDPGPPGPPGQPGIAGIAGPQGPAGPPTLGPMGLNGDDGDDGMLVVGPRGATGLQGPAGTGGPVQGPPGVDGLDGDDAPGIMPGTPAFLNGGDVRVQRTAAKTLSVDAGGGAGTANLRVESTTDGLVGVFKTGDANGQAILYGSGTNGTVGWGPGGATPIDVALTRTGAKAIQLGDNAAGAAILDMSISKLTLPRNTVAESTTARLRWTTETDATTGARLLVYDSQRERDVAERGWLPYAWAIGAAADMTFATALALPINGGSVAIPIGLDSHMLLQQMVCRVTAASGTGEFRLYVQRLNNGNAGENTLDEVPNSAGTIAAQGAAANVGSALTSPPVYLGPGAYWLVIRCTSATTAFNLGTLASGTMALTNMQTKTLGSGLAATLDFVAATWAKGAGTSNIPGVRLEGRVFGQTAAY